MASIKIIDTSESSGNTGGELYNAPSGGTWLRAIPFNTDWEYFETQVVNNRTWYNLGGSQWISDEYAAPGIKTVKSALGTAKVANFGSATVYNAPNGRPSGQTLPANSEWKYNTVLIDTKNIKWFNAGHSQWITTREVIDIASNNPGWKFPFKAPYNNANSVSGGQLFGYTRDNGRAFHDGTDFGSNPYGNDDKKIRAIHSGTVVFEGRPGNQAQYIGNEIIVIRTSDNLDIIYQEFGVNSNDASVHYGDHVNTGDVIGYFDVGGYNGVTGNSTISHVHIGISNKDWKSALSSYNVDDGTYYDPIKIIRNQGI